MTEIDAASATELPAAPEPAAPVVVPPNVARQLWDLSRTSFPVLSRVISLVTVSSVVTLLAQWHEFRSNVDKDLADRFSTAIVAINDPEPAIRIAALYDLERIAASSPQYREPLKEILPVYLHDHSPEVHGSVLESATPAAEADDHAALNLDAIVHEDHIGNDARAALDVLLRLTAPPAANPGQPVTLPAPPGVPAPLPINPPGLFDRLAAWVAARFAGWVPGFGGAPAPLAPASGECLDLSGINLHGATFIGGALDGDCFVGSDLVGAVFSHAQLSRVDFTDAVLVDAIFSGTGTTIANAIFTGANLEWADFSGASLTSVLVAPGAARANLDGSNWIASRLQSVYVADATLAEANFEKAQLDQVTFSDGVDLASARFADSRLANVAFTDAQLTNVDFTGATLRCVRFPGSRVEADFRSATFDGVDLRSADLTRSQISPDQLKHAYYDQTTIWPDPQFKPPPPTLTLTQLTAQCQPGSRAAG
jgi:uncharacterized protein YjbI with pentapeptide repeats